MPFTCEVCGRRGVFPDLLAPVDDVFCGMSYPVIGAGKVIVSTSSGDVFNNPSGVVEGFDAAGLANCRPDDVFPPVVCESIWRGFVFGHILPPAFADGRVYVSTRRASVIDDFESGVFAFDANTSDTRLWSAVDDGGGVPAIANGVLYAGDNSQFVPSSNDRLSAFDATGTVGCSGTPTRCNSQGGHPLPHDTFDAEQQPVIANGFVYVVAADGVLHAYTVPA